MRQDSSSTRNVFLLLWSASENFLFGSFIKAWPSLVALFKMDGVYSHVCEPLSRSSLTELSVLPNVTSEGAEARESGGLLDGTQVRSCADQDEAFNFAYTWAMILGPSLAYAVAQVNYLYGLRATRLVTIVFLAVGFACLALGSKEFPSPLSMGLTSLLVGSMGLYITCNQVCYTFHAKAATASAFVTGAASAGAGVIPQLFHLAHRHGITTQQSFHFMVALLVIPLLGTFYLFHKGFFTSEASENGKTSNELALQRQALLENDYKSSQETRLTNRKVSFDNGSTSLEESTRKTSLVRTVASSQFILLMVWRVVNSFLLNFTRGILNAWLQYVTKHDQTKVISMTTVYSNAAVICLPVALLSGSFFDLITQCLPDKLPYRSKIYVSSATCVGLSSLIGAAICACAISEKMELVFVMMLLMVVHMVVFFSFLSACLRHMYHEENFGVLYLISSMVVVPFTFLQIPLFSWCKNDSRNWSQLYWLLLLLMLSSLTLPVYLLKKARSSNLRHQLTVKNNDANKL